MGQNLALNIADHGYRVAVYNRTTAAMQAFVDGHGDMPGGLVGIRARFLQKITEAYRRKPALVNLMLDPYFKRALAEPRDSWREVVALAVRHGIPAPAFGSALAYFDGYRSARLPANLTQAQRDYFGAHTYERVDAPRGTFFHVDWPDPTGPERPV